MRRLILLPILFVLFTVSAFAQAECEQNGGDKKCVLTRQAFIDAANQAFKEVAALRIAVDAQAETIKAKNEALVAKNQALKSKDDQLKIKDEQIQKLIKVTCTKSSFLIFIYRSKKCF